MPLIHITEAEYNVELCIAYATVNNFTGAQLYKHPHCYLHDAAVRCLEKTIALTAPLGLRVKIFDAFRPLETQKALWAKYPDPEFISNPETGRTPHCRGIAIDMTLTDVEGVELDMGTEFDAFTPLSHHANLDISREAQQNRHMLMGIMTVSGWLYNPNEWWHYQLPSHELYEKLTDKEAGTGML